MSRIEEALRRAAVPSGPRSLQPVREPARSLLAEATLGSYPMEAPTPVLELPARPLRHRTGVSHPRTDAAAAPTRTARLGRFASGLEGKIVLGQATPVAVEQYRRLAATLHELQAERGVKTLMV